MWLVALGVLGIVLLAAIPLRLDFRLNTASGGESQVTFTWAGCVRVRTQLALPSRGTPRSVDHEVGTKRTAKKAMSRVPRSLYSRETLSFVIECVGRLLRQTQVGPTQFTLRFGCNNPADTGIVFASLVPLQLLFGRAATCVTLEPCVWEECFEPRGHGQLILVPIRYLAVLGSIAVSPRTWKLVFDLMRESRLR